MVLLVSDDRVRGTATAVILTYLDKFIRIPIEAFEIRDKSVTLASQDQNLLNEVQGAVEYLGCPAEAIPLEMIDNHYRVQLSRIFTQIAFYGKCAR